MATAIPLSLEPHPLLDRIELDLATMTPEQRAERERALDDIRSRPRDFVSHAVVQGALAERRRRQEDCATCRGEGEVAGATCSACQGSGGFCKVCHRAWPACTEVGACTGLCDGPAAE